MKNSENEIKKKSIHGVLFLSVRRFVLLITAFFSNIVLSRTLSPSDFGIFAISSFIIGFFNTNNDLGLNAALIQKKDINEKYINSVFSLQQLFSIFFILLIFFLSSQIHLFLKVSDILISVTQLMLISLLMLSLAASPMAILERKLDFDKVSFIEISSSLIYQIFSVIFALMGYGIWSFVIAYTGLSFTKLLLAFIFSGLRPRFYIDIESLKELFNFGIPFQLNSLITSCKDAIIPIFVGSFVGALGVGYLDWSKKIIIIPALLTESFGRVAFPAFSKIQNDKIKFSKVITQSIEILTFFTVPITFYFMIFAKDIIHFIYTDKWLSALPALYFFSLGAFSIGLITPIYQAILSIGKTKKILKITVLLLILEWGLSVPLVIKLGFIGVPIISIPVAYLSVYLCNKILKDENIVINIWNSINKIFYSSIIVFAFIYFLNNYFQSSLVNLILLSLLTICLYVAFSYLLNRATMLRIKNIFIELLIFRINNKAGWIKNEEH